MSAPAPLTYSLRPGKSDDTILYLHGFMGCREDWAEIVELVGPRWAHLTVDLPGHGRAAELLRSELTDHDFTMPGCASLLIRLLDDLHIERCHLVGYSMGGRLALYLLIHHGERFARAVVESASPGLAIAMERRARVERDRELAARLEREPFDKFLESWYAQPLFATLDRQSQHFKDLLERRRLSHPDELARSLRLMGTGAQPSLWDDLRRITSSVLFVTGALDTKFTAIAAKMAPLCRDAATAIIPDTGHNVHLERPDAYSNDVETFFSAG